MISLCIKASKAVNYTVFDENMKIIKIGGRKMKVTFMIGNGFDIKMGMKTRYKDMYDSYINTKSNDETISLFKEVLKSDKPNNYTNWSDFESAMGRHADLFENEDCFIKCVRDFRSHLVKCLEEEESRFKEYVSSYDQYGIACTKVIDEAILDFYKGQTPNVINQIYKPNIEQDEEYRFITFNYTRVLEFLLAQYHKRTHFNKIDSPIHIHGKLGGDVVLGVDNVLQFEGPKYPVSKKIERAFVKPAFNAEYDVERVNKARQLINESDVICIYGMSFGITDKTWVDEVASWLLADSEHHLIFFQYSEDKFDSWNGDEKMDEEDDRKIRLLNRIFTNKEEIQTVYDNVHIPVGFDIFNINEKLEKNKMKIDALSGPLPVGIY